MEIGDVQTGYKEKHFYEEKSPARQQLTQRSWAVSVLEKTQCFSRPEWIKP